MWVCGRAAWIVMPACGAQFSVISNLAVVVFANPAHAFYVSSPLGKVVLFLLLEHGVYVVKYACALIIPDVPSDVQMQLARQVRARPPTSPGLPTFVGMNVYVL